MYHFVGDTRARNDADILYTSTYILVPYKQSSNQATAQCLSGLCAIFH